MDREAIERMLKEFFPTDRSMAISNLTGYLITAMLAEGQSTQDVHLHDDIVESFVILGVARDELRSVLDAGADFRQVMRNAR